MAKKSLRGPLHQALKVAAVRAAHGLCDRELLERFVAEKDEAAFAALVERHGPVVLGVCRRLLGSAHDAEDACQAAFLVLAQKAASVRKTTSLCGWLHGVASRVAGHVRRERLRRGRREQETRRPAVADPAAEVSWREVRAVLDEELERLPDRLRAPLILCYLDGRTRDVAAQQLGLSVACLHGRLERGRKALCEGLTRRGVTLSAALLAAAVGAGAARAALPPTTVLHTARAAALCGHGRALGNGLIPPEVLSLAQEVLTTMSLTKLKLGVCGLLCAGLLAAVLGGSLSSVGAGEQAQAPPAAGPSQPVAGQAPKPAPAAQPAPRPAGEIKYTTVLREFKTPPGVRQAPRQAAEARPAENLRVSGRVMGPDGKPVAGAKVYLLKWRPPPWLRQAEDKAPPKVWAETDKDGRFSFTAAQRDWGELFVTAAGYGPGWVIKPGRLQETWPIEDDQVVRLARDDVPVSGRLLDLQGQPVAGATVRVFALKASPDGSLDKWVEAVKKRRLGEDVPEQKYLSSYHVDGLAHLFPPLTTDKDGRFQVRGVGRERVVAFTVEGPAIETRVIHVLTRPGVGVGEVRVPEASITFGGGRVKELRLKPYYPPTFTHTADPCRVVIGVVRDQATGKPIAGAIVREEEPARYPLYYNRTTTDKEGRFRLTGLPLATPYGAGPSVVALPPDGEPYLALVKRLPADKETKEAALDFDLPRGVWVEGQVKDKATGRGVVAQLRYVVFQRPTPPEPGVPIKAPPGFGSGGPYYRDPYGDRTDEEGKFRILAAQGRGLLGASAIGKERGRYRAGVGADKIEGLNKNKRAAVAPVPEPFGLSAGSFDTVVEVNPERGAKSVRCDVVLDPGRTLTVQVRGPDGKPLDGARAHGQFARAYPDWGQGVLPAEFTVYALGPGEGRTLLLDHPGRNLTARHEIKGDERGPVVVTLRPAAAAVGRLVDDAGRPLAHAEVSAHFRLAGDDRFLLRHHSRDQSRTDAEGMFRIDGLIAGVPYQGYYRPTPGYIHRIFADLSLKAGELKDLGDVTVKQGDSQ
jgi:RNA polymerase sigma factor (sigma-70 family)